MRCESPRRRGLAIFPAFICLVLVTLMSGVLLKLAASHRALTRSEQRKAQADWLVESGVSRAAARLATNSAYPGETWEIPANEMAGGSAAIVRITVESMEKNKKGRRIRFEADYPRGDTLRARSSKSLSITLGPGTSGGSS